MESARPLASLAFVAPLLVIYELGILVLGPHALRNGADTWLRHMLEFVGFGQYFLLPILTCGILLGWHHTRQDRWSVEAGVLTTMVLESLLCALILFGLAHLQRVLFVSLSAAIPCAAGGASGGLVGRLVGYCGAGIYEELLFRLILLPAFAGLLRSTGLPWRTSWIWGILATSLIFSAAHYQPLSPGGYEFDWFSFVFRFAAGSFFAALFVLRGFGIAAGAHALYDILVELL